VYHIDSLHSPQHSVTAVVFRSVIKYMHHINALHIMAKILRAINVNMK